MSDENTILYTQLQPWSSSNADPCMEIVAGPSVPTKLGISYKVCIPL